VEYNTEAEFQAAMDEWTRKKAGGDPFPGPTPQRSAKLSAENAVNQAGFDPKIKNEGFYQQAAQQGANMGPRENPFSTVVADQSRPAQLALMQQMRAGLDGPSIAAMQGQRALAQSGQQALMRGGRAGMLGAQGVGAGLAGDVGQARLAEVMRGQAGLGSAASNLRGGDLRTADASSQSGLQMRGLDDNARRFYASQGVNLQQAQDRANLEMFKLKQRKLLEDRERQMKALNGAVGGLATTAGGLATGGK
jgi:hypothetical protein